MAKRKYVTMTKNICLYLGLVLFLNCYIQTAALASEIQFMTHNIKEKTFIDEKGELRGKKHGGRRAFNLELVREMMILMNSPGTFEEVPFARGLLYVQNNKNFALFNVTRKPDRENTVKWVGPLQSDTAYFYELKSAPTGIRTLEDAKKVDSICVLNKGVHDTFLQEKGFDNLQYNVSYTGCFKMLANKRVSLTPSGFLPLVERLRTAGLSLQDVKRIPVSLFDSEGYLTFSKNISDNVIQQWQNALDELKQSGKYDQLIQEYLLAK
jgi:polar amino acid transport system substrate-binding protein